MTQTKLLALAAFFGFAGPTLAAEPPAWLPDPCSIHVAELPSGSAEELWNRLYRAGIEALQKDDFDSAEPAFCNALAMARKLGPRDIRFAETLDELGLLFYRRGNDEISERMQGAAVAEMLLALGPVAPSMDAAAEDLCRSSTRTYLERLSWIYSRQGRREKIDELRAAPYRIFARGYVPAESLLPRLEWLISRYLLAEDMVAAEWLSALRDRPSG